MDEMIEWRREFPILDKTVYLISHSLGAMPRQTRDRLIEYADVWSTRGIRAWEEGWWEMPGKVGDLVGEIIGARSGEVVMHQNVSIAQSTITSCFDWSKPPNKVVTEALNFTTNLYILHGLEKLGATISVVGSDDGVTTPLDRMLAAIDRETRLVVVSHVAFLSSSLQDLRAITERAHEMGAMVVADLYQSAGTLPVNVRELGVDFATGGSVKWLCGGPGAGYLYVRRELWERLEPTLTGWMAHEEPFAFEGGAIRYARTAYRFLNGTPNIPGLYAARTGYDIINRIGVQNIRRKSMAQTAKLIELSKEAGFKVNSPLEPGGRGGTVVIDVLDAHQVTEELLRRDFLVDFRPRAGIRISPHFYTKDEELELIVREIKGIIASKSQRIAT
jgi:kynureninase